MQQLLVTLTLLISSSTVHSHNCDSFDNVEVRVYRLRDDKPYLMNLTGCIERTAFEEKINQIYVKNQNVPRLGPDSIRNMQHLHSALFFKTKTEAIEPGAFRNVPNLNYIKIINGKLETIPKGVFNHVPKLETLKLSHNKISKVEKGALVNITLLKNLHCDDNDLSEWKKSWFVNTTKIAFMDFSHNKIPRLPRGAFDRFSKLKTINFDFNELQTVESEAFDGITSLDYLGLKSNRLKFLHPRIFPNNIDVKFLTLSANYLNFLPRKMMVTVSVEKVEIYGNPWKCPCLDQVHFWVYETNATVSKPDSCGENVPVCSVPLTFSQTCQEVVDDDVTRRYLDQMKQLEPPSERFCARLD